MENAALKIKGQMKLPCEIPKLLKVCANCILRFLKRLLG